MMIGGGEQVELVSAPEQAEARRRIFERHLKRNRAQTADAPMLGGGEIVELVHAPDLADVRRQIFERPLHLADQPLAIDPVLWEKVELQLEAVLADRGWPVLSSADCKLPNFLLCGVPVVMIDG